MNRQEATKILKGQANYWRGVTEHNGIDSNSAHEVNTIIAGLDWAYNHMACKSQNTPDPDTGLVPCGCGGKAQLGILQYTISDPDLMPEYYAYCQDCGITTENSADRERVEAAWNRAMGRASE